MKSSFAFCFCCVMAVACSRESHPRDAAAPTQVSAPPAISRLEDAPVQTSHPTGQGIPTAPAVAPPVAPPAVPTDQVPLTPASGNGTARTASAALVPAAPSPDDKAESAQDREALREIRALVASDPALASSASHLVIVARGGRIWLRGQVNTAAQRAAIEKAARQAAGVIDVRNELAVLE
jgi:hypothetical protein